MPSPIQLTNLPQYQPYCATTDVLNLIGSIVPMLSNSVPASAISMAIKAGTDYIETQTNRFYSPRRVIDLYDGSGKSRMVLKNDHVLAVNEVNVYFTYPVALARIAHDWDLFVDREAGILSFPPYSNAPYFAPFAYTFFPSSRNVKVDAWHGFAKWSYSETLTATDSKTFTFANPAAYLCPVGPSYEANNPPSFYPLVYVNGALQTNTTYTLVTSTDASANNQWEIASDNLVYTLTTGSNGITGIVFNAPVSGTVTVDYPYWYIPDEIREACAKKAAITILTGIGTAPLADQAFQGASEVQIDGARIQYQGGPFSGVIKTWQDEIDAVIKRQRKPVIAFGIGYTDEGLGAW